MDVISPWTIYLIMQLDGLERFGDMLFVFSLFFVAVLTFGLFMSSLDTDTPNEIKNMMKRGLRVALLLLIVGTDAGRLR